MKKTKTKLKAVINDIASARDKFQAKTAMKELTHMLGTKSLTDADRQKAQLQLQQLMRDTILAHAEAHFIANPTLYPEYVAVLLKEIRSLKGDYIASLPSAGDIELFYDLPSIDAIGIKTSENIQAFFTHAYSDFADNKMRDEGYKYLRFVSEQEVICIYINIAASQPDLPWRESYVMTLFMASDMALIDGYPIDFLYFSETYIEIVTTWNIPSKTSLKKLRLKLQVVFNAFNHMDSRALIMFVNELEVNLLSAVIEDYIDSLGGKEALPADISCLLECLDEVIQPLDDSTGDAEPNEADSIETLTTATEMLHFLCTHRDSEFLVNDWVEYKTALASPIFGGIMRMRAHEALAVHILSYILEHVDVSEEAKCKIRLYLALTLSPGIALYGDEILRWIMGEVADK